MIYHHRFQLCFRIWHWSGPRKSRVYDTEWNKWLRF